MASAPQKISVIIPALNAMHRIGRAIESVSEADQVVVVDGGSHDATVDIAAKFGCLVTCSRTGRGSQLRHGAGLADGEVLLFLHADCALGKGALAQLRELAGVKREVGLFGAFEQQIESQHRKYRWLEWGNASRARLLRLPYGDQGVFIDRETYIKAGQFADVPLMEDVILARAAAKWCDLTLLPGPILVNPSRWEQSGVLVRTLRNWTILCAFFMGVSPRRLVAWYGT